MIEVHNEVPQAKIKGSYVWRVHYDGLGRRIQTDYIPAGANTVTIASNRIRTWFDPQVEFMTIAVEHHGKREWMVRGPDMDADYGSFQGLGGLEAIIDEATGKTTPIIDTVHGHVVATIDLGDPANTADDVIRYKEQQFGGYGPLPGSVRQQPLEVTEDLATSLGWQTRCIDPTGFFAMGARHYDPLSGRFLSADPFGHGATPDLYSYAGGDPINFFDSTGRSNEGYWSEVLESAQRIFGFAGTFAGHAVNLYEGQERNWDTVLDPDTKPNAIGNAYQFLAGGSVDAEFNEYGNNDLFTLDLVQSENFQTQVLTEVSESLSQGVQSDTFNVSVFQGSKLDIVMTMANDALSYATGGYLGNNATEAVVGSYGGTWTASNISYANGTAVVTFKGINHSSANSLTRIPIDGWGYGNNNNPSLQDMIFGDAEFGKFSSILSENPFGPNGLMTTVTQTFTRTQVVHFDPVAGNNPNIPGSH